MDTETKNIDTNSAPVAPVAPVQTPAQIAGGRPSTARFTPRAHGSAGADARSKN